MEASINEVVRFKDITEYISKHNMLIDDKVRQCLLNI